MIRRENGFCEDYHYSNYWIIHWTPRRYRFRTNVVFAGSRSEICIVAALGISRVVWDTTQVALVRHRVRNVFRRWDAFFKLICVTRVLLLTYQVCMPSVVEEFLQKASMLQLVDQRQRLLTKERIDRNTGGDVRFDLFFPFDPYLLRQSDRYEAFLAWYWTGDTPRFYACMVWVK